tara:strand:+ start:592 stop:1080 length:489 start_codon:yes stop_codon:yes gene_type:complete
MASTVVASTLTVTLTESITLNGQSYGSTRSHSIASVNEIYKRVLTIPANNDTTVVSFKSATSTSDVAIDIQDAKYLRITNLDDTNAINLSFQIDAGEDDSAADESATISLAAGQSFIMGTPHDSIAVSDANATIVTDLHDLESVLIDSSSNAVDVEVFVAST